MKVIIKKNFAYPDDVRRIQKILQDRDYEATLSECEELWDMYSDSMCAGWMILSDDDDEVFSCISSYITTE